METTTPHQRTHTSCSGAPSAGGRWARFAAGLAGILLLAFVVIPALQRLQPIREVRAAIQAAGIDATALFYTESDVSAEAEAAIRNAIRYAPYRPVGGRGRAQPAPRK